MATKESLKTYHNKRDFDGSAEPFGEEEHQKKEDKQIFVIQKHEASTLHYDFRLLVDGFLKSWAVPKGPSTDPQIKRLAIRTEDHPIEYADFEGVIPEDQYGGGTVMVWDAGTYSTLAIKDEDESISLSKQLKSGHCKFTLKGKKLQGGFVLLRTQKDEKQEKWLLKKIDDDKADARRKPANTQNKSVLTGRSMQQIRKEEKDEG